VLERLRAGPRHGERPRRRPAVSRAPAVSQQTQGALKDAGMVANAAKAWPDLFAAPRRPVMELRDWLDTSGIGRLGASKGEVDQPAKEQ